MADERKWHVLKTLPPKDDLVWRRFGSKHEKPCLQPSVISCAMWECQEANRCRIDGALKFCDSGLNNINDRLIDSLEAPEEPSDGR